MPWNVGEAGAEASARWRSPDGPVRTGHVFVLGSAAAGGTVMVWTNQAGQLTDSPLQPSQIEGRAGLSEALAVAGLAVALIAAGWAVRLGTRPAPTTRLGRGMAGHRTPVELPPVAGP